MKRIVTTEIPQHIGEEITLYGWVNNRRDHGKLIFIDLRDREGEVQVVFFSPNLPLADKLRGEWVIEIKGKVNKRPDNMVNPEHVTGEVEIEAIDFKVLSEAETIPFSIEGDGYEINEETRMKYRFVDLRRRRLLNNLKRRQDIINTTRQYLIKEGFIEVETPIISKSTPEGARDFLVPARLDSGKFFGLPQSPQQFKQILMTSGIEKYFQIARCFRDEDPRGDRQAEFTQVDLEMSFVKQEDVMDLIENMLIHLVETLYPEKKIQKKPFPLITYKEAMDKYGVDRPDLRENKDDPNELAFCWVVDFPFFEKDKENKWTFTHNPFSQPKPEFEKDLLEKKNIENILTTQYDVVLNGWEIGGGSIRAHAIDMLQSVFDIMGYQKEEVENNFGHFLKAFKYGVPPHGGLAIGLDRFISLMQQEPNIREVIAFPKTGDNRDLMMEAPSGVTDKQLKDLHIKHDKKS